MCLESFGWTGPDSHRLGARSRTMTINIFASSPFSHRSLQTATASTFLVPSSACLPPDGGPPKTRRGRADPGRRRVGPTDTYPQSVQRLYKLCKLVWGPTVNEIYTDKLSSPAGFRTFPGRAREETAPGAHASPQRRAGRGVRDRCHGCRRNT